MPSRTLANAVSRVPFLIKGGIAVGAMTGLGVGSMGQPPLVGAAIGLCLGVVAGAMAGIAMHRDAVRDEKRGKQLDDIIGVTGGSLGAPPGSIPPGDLRRDPEAGLELESWAKEWLTPPPPATMT